MKIDPEFRKLLVKVAALQEKARALGLFVGDRELLECPKCGLLEDIAFSGQLFTYRPKSPDDGTGTDTGLRFTELPRNRFRCPACGATVREPVRISPAVKPKERRKRSSRSSRSRN